MNERELYCRKSHDQTLITGIVYLIVLILAIFFIVLNVSVQSINFANLRF